MRICISKKDIFWSYLGHFFTLFTNISILPFVMKLVPTSELGLWYTFLSVGQIVSIFDGIFSGSISRNITYAWSGASEIFAEGINSLDGTKKTNYRLLVSILITCKRIFALIAIISLIIFLGVGTAYIGYTAVEISKTLWITAWMIYVVGIVFNLYYSYWITALRGVGAITQAQKASVISKIVQIIVSLTGLYFGGGIVALSLAFLLSGFVLRIMGKASLLQYEKMGQYYRKYFHSIKAGEIKNNGKKIWFNSKKSGLVCLGAYGITQSITLLCSAFLGLEETASYGLCQQIINALTGVALIYFKTMRSKLTELKMFGKNGKNRFIESMSLAVTIYWILYMVEMIVMVVIGLPMMSLLKSDTELPVQMLVFMGIYLFLENNHSLFAGIIEMSNTIPYVKQSLISAICIVCFGFLSAKYTSFGIYGLMFVQFIVQLCYNNWKWPMVIMKQYKLTPVKILKLGIKEGISTLKKVF